MLTFTFTVNTGKQNQKRINAVEEAVKGISEQVRISGSLGELRELERSRRWQ